MVGRTGKGEFLVSGVVGGGRIDVFDSAGAFVRSIGRRGAGPGEFGNIVRLAVGAGDTIHVMDDSNVRVQILSPNGEYVRSFPSPARNRSFALLASGAMVFFRRVGAVGDKLYSVVDGLGADVGRLGVTTGVPLDLETGIVVPARGGGVWTASYWKYELSRLSSLDSAESVLTREASWFPPNAPYPADAFKTSLPPSLVHAWEDSAGGLWAYVAMPDPRWKPGGPSRQSPDWYRYTFDTVVEVIDVEKAELIASSRFDGRFGIVCNSPLMYTIIETPDGDTRIQVVEPVLSDPR